MDASEGGGHAGPVTDTSPHVLPELAAEARAFAARAHGDQRYGDHPYVVHLDEVVGVLLGVLEVPAPELLVIGYLHDVVEDTEVTLDHVGERFGDGVARCVDLLTDAPGNNRKERKAATYARLAEVGRDAPDGRALVVKAADRLANVRRCVADENRRLLSMYRDEHVAFRSAVWRQSLVLPLWRELDELLAR